MLKKRIYIPFLLFIILSFFPQHTISVKPEIQFAFVFNSVLNRDPMNIYLYGSHPIGSRVALLEKDCPSFFYSKVIENSTYESMIHEFEISRLTYKSWRKSATDFSLAVIDIEVYNYEVVPFQAITDKKITESFDKIIRSSDVLKRLSKKAQGVVPGDVSIFEKTFPKIYHLSVQIAEVYIAVYENSEDIYEPRPRVALINGIPYPLTGWCSFPDLRFFKLNDTYYIESGSFCCGCGIRGKELFQITKSRLVRVHCDSSESD